MKAGCQLIESVDEDSKSLNEEKMMANWLGEHETELQGYEAKTLIHETLGECKSFGTYNIVNRSLRNWVINGISIEREQGGGQDMIEMNEERKVRELESQVRDLIGRVRILTRRIEELEATSFQLVEDEEVLLITLPKRR